MVQINPQLNQQTNQYQQPLTGVGVGAAQMQNIAPETISQGINNNPITKNFNVDDNKYKWVIPTFFLPLFAGVSYGMKKFNEACRGKYEESLVGRLGNWGDKVGESAFFKSSFFTGLNNTVKDAKNFFKTKVIKNSKILTSLFRTPAKPTVSVALTQMKGTIAEIASAAAQDFAKYTKNGTENLDTLFKGLDIPKEKYKETYDDIVKNYHSSKNIERIKKICGNQGVDGSFKVGRDFRFYKKGKFVTEIFPWTKKLFGEKTVYFAEHLNKLQALSGANKTWLGRALPRTLIRGLEGLTFGNTGGPFGMAMAVGFLASAIKDTIKAPKGDKGKTFAERNIYNLGFYLTMPLATRIMYHAGGLEYTGMSKKQVTQYRRKLDAFNKKVDEFGFKDKAEYKAELKEIKAMLKGHLKTDKDATAAKKVGNFFANIIRKPIKWAGKVLMVGSELPKAYVTKDMNPIAKFVNKIGYGFKYGAGYPVRFILFLFVIAPPLANLCAKGSHLIFGRPKKSVLDKEPEAKPANVSQQATAAIQSRQQLNAIPKAVAPVSGNNSNLLTNYKSNYPTQVIGQQTSAPQALPSAQAAAKPAVQNEQGPVRTYVPSSAGVQIQSDSNNQAAGQPQGLDKATLAMNKSYKAEQDALKFLKV